MINETQTTTSIHAAGALGREVHFTLPAEQLEAAVRERLKRVSRSVRINGFRPGHAPMAVVERQHGARLRGEALGELIDATVSRALAQNQLRPVGSPQVEPAPNASAEELAFIARFEIFPEITLASFANLTLTLPQSSITDADVERTLARLRQQRAQWTAVDRAAATGDRLLVDFTGRLDGVEFEGGKASDTHIVLGASGLLPEFDRELLGVSAGTTRTFAVQFPDAYPRSELAGQATEFEVVVKGVEQPLLPDLDDAFAATLGVTEGGAEALNARIRESLEAEATRLIALRRKTAVLELLLANHDFALPHELVHNEAHQLAQRAKPERTDAEAHAAEHEFEEAAQQRVKLGLILAEVARTAQLTADPARVRQEIEQIAQRFDDGERVVQWYYADPARLRDIENGVLEQQLMDWVIRQVQTEPLEVGFEELTATANPGRA